MQWAVKPKGSASTFRQLLEQQIDCQTVLIPQETPFNIIICILARR
jgi:hypothetical protein